MKIAARVAFLVAEAFLTPTAWPHDQSVQPQGHVQAIDSGTGAIAGVVLDADTGQPLPNAWVVLREGTGLQPGSALIASYQRPNAAQVPSYKTSPDPTGRFEIQGVPPGEYLLWVGGDGYVAHYYKQESNGLTGGKLILQADTKLTLGSPILLVAAGVIAGRVTDKQRRPLPWTLVQAIQPISQALVIGNEMRPIAQIWTNDRGEYRFFGLPPGRYYVAARFQPGESGAMPVQQEFPVPGFGRNDFDSVQYFYPGTTDPATAGAIEVVGGKEALGIDFSLADTSMHEISGAAFSKIPWIPDNTNISLMLAPADRNYPVYLSLPRTNVARGGHFKFRDVLPGSYVIWARQAAPQGSFIGRVEVTVRNADVAGLNVIIQPGPNLPGHLTSDAESQPTLTTRYRVEANPSDGRPFGWTSSMVQPDGSFVLKNIPPGSYLIKVTSMRGNVYLKSARLGERDVSVEPFEVQQDSALGTLDLRVSLKSAKVSGVVTARVPAANGATVVLVPQGPLNRVPWFYRSTHADKGGYFAIDGIAPGNYKLFAWDHVSDGMWLDPEFLKPIQEKGTDVTLAEDDDKTVQLREIPLASSTSSQP